MRVHTTIFLSIAIAAAAPVDQKKPPAKQIAVAPKHGIKTPGVQIPFDSLKAELEFATPANPEWIAFADNVFLPNTTQNSLERIDPKVKESKFLDPIKEVAKPCGGVVNGFTSLWVPACGDRALAKVDAKGAKVASKLAIGSASARGTVAASTDSLWMLTDDKTTLSRIDPLQNVVVGEFRLPAGCFDLTFAEASLWVICPADNKVLRISPESGLVDKSIEVGPQPKSLAAGEGSIWVLCAKDGKIDRIDPKTNKVSKTIDLLVPGAEGSLAFGEGSLWVTMTGFPLTRINPTTETVAQQFYGEGGGVIQTGGGFIWLANAGKGTLLKIDPKRVLATLAE